MNTYELILKNGKLKLYDQIASFLILINLSVFTLLAFQSADNKIKMPAMVAAVILAVLLLIQFFLQKIQYGKNAIYTYACLFISASTWVTTGKWWIGALCFFLAALYQVSKRQLSARFSTDHIVCTSFPVKTIEWSQLNNAILKDGILTIDFKNNKIIQAEIEDTANNINEKDFNDFCRQHLKVAD